MSVGLGLSYLDTSFSETTTFGATPALRYYTSEVFRGLWFELAGSLGAQATSGNFNSPGPYSLGGLGGLGALDDIRYRTFWSVQFAGSVSLGYTFHWDNGLMFSLSGGPSLQVNRSRVASSSSVTFGLQAAVSVGVAF